MKGSVSFRIAPPATVILQGTVSDAASGAAVAPQYSPVNTTMSVYSDATLDLRLTRASACPAIGFDDLRVHGAVFTTYTAGGLTVTPSTTKWTVSTNYGHPAPFIQFQAAAGTTTTGEIVITAAGAGFSFQSVDVYSSTSIPAPRPSRM